jgi:[ribosomal protein S18]-alanine N-acetyltransferase
MIAPPADKASPLRFSSLQVRPMRSADIPRVMEIANRLPSTPHWPVASYETALNPRSEPRRIALVAETREPDLPNAAELGSGAVAGFVVASLVAGEAELESIAVAAEAQRCGIGGILLEHLLDALAEIRVHQIHLEIRASNGAALGLYRRCGFRETGRRVGYYADPIEDAMLMTLDLG